MVYDAQKGAFLIACHGREGRLAPKARFCLSLPDFFERLSAWLLRDSPPPWPSEAAEVMAHALAGPAMPSHVDVRHRRRGAGLLVLELARELLQQFLRLAANAGGQHTFCVAMTGELTANTTTCFCPPAMPSSRRLGHFLPCAELSPFSSGHLPAA